MIFWPLIKLISVIFSCLLRKERMWKKVSYIAPFLILVNLNRELSATSYRLFSHTCISSKTTNLVCWSRDDVIRSRPVFPTCVSTFPPNKWHSSSDRHGNGPGNCRSVSRWSGSLLQGLELSASDKLNYNCFSERKCKRNLDWKEAWWIAGRCSGRIWLGIHSADGDFSKYSTFIPGRAKRKAKHRRSDYVG